MMIWAVACGGALGALARWQMTRWVASVVGHGLPWGTLAVNVLGSLLIGMVYVLFTEKIDGHETLRTFIVVGLLGAFTTFSTFSLDTFNLLQAGQFVQAATYVVVSVLVCLLSVWIGMALLRLLA